MDRNYWHEVVKTAANMENIKQLEGYELQLGREYNLTNDDVTKYHLSNLMKSSSELKRKYYFGNDKSFKQMIEYETFLIKPKRKNAS